MIGKKILHYKILEKLGEGGMGIVYKAEDTKLNREVAIKILPPHLLVSEDDRARFNREAKAAAALNHAHIATVYEINETDGQPFIVMEFIAGATLDQTIAKGPMKLEDAIAITIQIADGLGAAHKKDVVHRDIKASNILLGENNKAKILDFGLAKTSMSTKLTQMGTTIGTVAYMSPEQVRGQEVDHRTDLWSLGILLYEMIAGHLPFKAEYDQAVFYSIQNENPDPLTAVRTGVPMSLEWIVNKLMAKDSKERYQSAQDLIIDLKAVDLADSGFSRISNTSSQITSQKTVISKTKSAATLTNTPAILFSFVIVALIAGFIGSFFNSEDDAANLPVRNLSIILPEAFPLLPVGVAPLGVGQPALALSPDGNILIYVGDDNGEPHLFERRLDERNVRKLPGTNGAYMPFFSPDGHSVGFFSEDRLKKIDLQGNGIPVVLCEAPDSRGATWAENDSIYLVVNQGTTIYKVSSSGGLPGKVNKKTVSSVVNPQMLPDNRHLLLSINGNIGILDSKTGESTILIKEGNNPRYLGKKIIAFGRRGQLLAARFALDSKSIIGPSVPVLNNIRTETLLGSAQATYANDGTLAFIEGQSVDKGEFVWRNQQGKETSLNFPADYYGTFRLSPDGTELAVTRFQGSNPSIWIYNLVQGSQSRFTSKGKTYNPVWSKDGQNIIFTIQMEGAQTELMIKGRNMAEAKKLGENSDAVPYDVSPDGKLISVYYRSHGDGFNIGVLPISGEESSAIVVNKPFHDWGASFSPDGRYMAYTSDQTGRSEVFVTAYPQTGQRWQVSFDGGEEPLWAPDGKTIYYSQGRKWSKVPIKLQPNFSAGKPQKLFEGPYINVGGLGYNVSPDGERFLLLKGSDMRTTNRIEIIQGWRDVLEKLLAKN